MINFDDYETEGIIGRKLLFCERLQQFSTDDLIMPCPDCQDFFLYCCSCSREYYNFETDEYDLPEKPCHHFRIVFTDGACRSNGQNRAISGLGFARGLRADAQYSVPVTESMDPGQKRTSQRAELLAAIMGVEHMAEADRLNEPVGEDNGGKAKKKGNRKGTSHDPLASKKSWIIATDSEYVVLGMTEWLPAWKANNFRTSRNTKPANLDLFLKLDAAVGAEEARQDLRIGFWHVSREYNKDADKLAKEGAKLGDPMVEAMENLVL